MKKIIPSQFGVQSHFILRLLVCWLLLMVAGTIRSTILLLSKHVVSHGSCFFSLCALGGIIYFIYPKLFGYFPFLNTTFSLRKVVNSTIDMKDPEIKRIASYKVPSGAVTSIESACGRVCKYGLVGRQIITVRDLK